MSRPKGEPRRPRGRRCSSASKAKARGNSLESAMATILRRRGYRVDVAKASITWRPLTPCRECGKRHPTCDSQPRSIGEDFFNVADLIAFRGDGWVVVQCGGKGTESSKRRALDSAAPWPASTRLVVIVRDNRVKAKRHALRAWERRGADDEWNEVVDVKTSLR